ncbi:MlaA family lipoprotein [Paraburkholderia aspalathi]|uniref:MlaA lipoprotein n=1 Tax=Paraburkholderia aspalathi TaxID=1324617 RepID=A0A1I7B3K1_9BURK|nr:MlaA family lipoprotein [Paraburkholderia aspalathi]SFT81725.1 MlaA lipoprotein [Paraburkholderia aspalathi]
MELGIRKIPCEDPGKIAEVPLGAHRKRVELFDGQIDLALATIADYGLLNPFSAASLPVQAAVGGTHLISNRADLLSASNLLSQAALDEYSFTRNLYLQRRRALSSKPGDPATLPAYGDTASR